MTIRAWKIKDLTIQGRGVGLAELLPTIDSQNREVELASRLAFVECGPPTGNISWGDYRIAEELLARNKDSIKAVEFSLRFEAEPWESYDHVYLRTSRTIIAAMRSLTSLVLKGPTVQLSASTLFKLLVNCPEQLEVLKVEHPIQPMTLYTWDHLRQWDLSPTLWGMTTTPLLEDAYSDIVEEVPVLVEMVLERHAKTLKTIRWLGSGGKANERLDLQWFLNTCPNLERVEIINDHGSCSFEKGEVGSVIISDGVFLADENRGSTLIDTSSKSSPLPPSSNLSRTSSRVGPQTPLLLLGSSSSSSSWACASTLTYLEINFRPSPNIRNEYRYKIQIESFYKRLGQLTALVELHVGCECRCHGSQLGTCQHTNCSDVDASNSPALLDMDTNIKADTTLEPTTIFDMSLATGLDHMAGLSKLQVLNISRIQGHNIQEAELEWMKMHWPRLRLLQGVKKQGLVDWLERNWPLQEVRNEQ
ncbi:hypothetical protein EC991_001820 [Linnemannia zychae]|nr:hypothetical protein EC991_001820 [Linnemannia zychae]